MIKRRKTTPKSNNNSNNEFLGAPASEGWKQAIKNYIKDDKAWDGLISTIFDAYIRGKMKEPQMRIIDVVNALKEIGSELKEEGVLTDTQEKYIDQFANEAMDELYNTIFAGQNLTEKIALADEVTKKAIKELNFNDFVNNLINNPFATKEAKERIMNLWLKENKINYKNETKKNSGSPLVERNGQKTKNVNNLLKHKKHTPKFTADFMSLFNRRDGFKYLTHNYDNSRMTLNEFVTEVKKTFEKYRYEKRLPGSLRYLMNMFINGGEWKDFEGKKCSEGYSSDNWIKWSEQNENMHPIMDIGGIEKIIQRFRHTIRIVSPDLLNVIELISQKFPAIEFDYSDQNLGKADFYTNVYILRWGLFGLIKDMADHKDYKNIKIEYKPGFDGDYFIRQIIITQIGSFSQKPIDDVVEKFKSEGGFFAENADKLMGYCNWSVESLWDGKPFRWNILKEESDREIEQIEKESITGFSHILTFYYKD